MAYVSRLAQKPDTTRIQRPACSEMELLTRHAFLSKPPDRRMGASAGFQQTAWTLSECHCSVAWQLWVAMSHTLTVLSADPEATTLRYSGFHARLSTASLCDPSFKFLAYIQTARCVFWPDGTWAPSSVHVLNLEAMFHV